MKALITVIILFSAITANSEVQTPCGKAFSQYDYENPQADIGGVSGDVENGVCVIKTHAEKLGNPSQAQVNALVAAYDARMASKQTAANALYSTISTRLEITITSKAELQSKLVDVWEALDTKEQAVWSAIEANGLNATRAGQLKQLAQARNKILRLLAEDGIQ